MDSRVVTFKAPTMDQAISTNEPEYERYLVIRIYTPQGIEETDLKCSIIYGEERLMTDVFEPENEEVGTI